MKQFDLKEYLANPSRKVVTRNGRNVRIICTDKKGFDYPIVALIENKLEGLEGALYYTKDGKYIANESSDSDLFFAPEKHEGWVNLYKWTNKDCAYYIGSMYNSKADAEKRKVIDENYVTTIKIEWEE